MQKKVEKELDPEIDETLLYTWEISFHRRTYLLSFMCKVFPFKIRITKTQPNCCWDSCTQLR